MGMASITIRDFGDDVETRHPTRAAGDRRSIAEEERQIPGEAVAREAESKDPAAVIRKCFAAFGGVELELPPHGQMRALPHLDRGGGDRGRRRKRCAAVSCHDYRSYWQHHSPQSFFGV